MMMNSKMHLGVNDVQFNFRFRLAKWRKLTTVSFMHLPRMAWMRCYHHHRLLHHHTNHPHPITHHLRLPVAQVPNNNNTHHPRSHECPSCTPRPCFHTPLHPETLLPRQRLSLARHRHCWRVRANMFCGRSHWRGKMRTILYSMARIGLGVWHHPCDIRFRHRRRRERE